MDVSQGTSKSSANFQIKPSKVKVTGYQKPQKTGDMITYGRRMKHRRLKTRSVPLLGLICCRCLSMRRLATERTAAYHVGSRHSAAICFVFHTELLLDCELFTQNKKIYCTVCTYRPITTTIQHQYSVIAGHSV